MTTKIESSVSGHTADAMEAAHVDGWMLFLAEPKNWIMVAFVLFFAFFGKKLFGALLGGLDYRNNRIKNELEHAAALRLEAAALLEKYKAKHAESMKEAEEILTRARENAEAMTTKAETELKEAIEARKRMADAKIEQAEKQAIDDIHDHVVDITIAAAKSLIIDNINDNSSDELVQHAIDDLARKVH